MGKIQFQGISSLMMFCALIITGLCFGQYVKSDIESCHAELVSASHSLPGFQPASRIVSTSHIGQYVKPLSQWDRLTMSNLQARIPQFFNTMLMMQTEGESLKPKTSFWKQAGIYGLEFVGASAVSWLSFYYCGRIWANPEAAEGHPEYFVFGVGLYIISGTFLPSGVTAYIGGRFNQNGSWIKSFIGSSIETLINLYVLYRATECDISEEYIIFSAVTTPSTLAVIGYNW